MKLKDYVYKLFFRILSLVSEIIPKKKKVLFLGGIEFCDNVEAMFRYCNENGDYEIVALTEKTINYNLRDGAKVEPRTKINVIREIMTSRVIVDYSLQGYAWGKTKKQVYLQLWHGSPLKSLGKSTDNDLGKNYTLVILASDLFRKEMQRALNVSNKNIVVKGFPRNDDLFRRIGDFDQFHLNEHHINIIWMPTFRHGIGREETEKDLPIVDKENVIILEEYLKRNNIKLYIKPHPLQQNEYNSVLENCKEQSIEIICNQQLMKADVPLYSFVGQMDALITDYSSVFFDYLLLDRPIGFTIDDMEEYGQNRGFVFDNPLDYMPGEKLHSIDDLVNFIDHVATGIDEWREERKKVNDLVNYYQDNHNCERCVTLIQKHLHK